VDKKSDSAHVSSIRKQVPLLVTKAKQVAKDNTKGEISMKSSERINPHP
jgi:hypothetical protein